MIITGKRFELLIGSLSLGAVLWNASTACSRTTASRLGCDESADALNCIGAFLVVSSNLPFTFSFRGQNFSGAGGTNSQSYQLFGLQSGPNEITGNTSAGTISFRITGRPSSVPGGVASGCLQSLAGPVASTTPCQVNYVAAPRPSRTMSA
jgi:hypothetical protein